MTARSLRKTVIWIVIDLAMTMAATIWTLNAWRAHNHNGMVVNGIVCLVWIVLAWSDIHRWTGPSRSDLRRSRQRNQ